MFLALRDLWFARGRFALMGAVVAMLALLMVLLTGLSTGLVDDNISGVRSLPADHLAFDGGAGVNFNRSTVDRRQWEGVAATPGVTASAPLGNSLFNAQAYHQDGEAQRARSEILAEGTSATKGTAVDIALFGVEPGSFITPAPVSGQAIGTTADGVLVSQALVAKGVGIGDRLVLDRVGTVVTVIGTTAKDNYGHVPVVWAPLPLWQEATFGPPGGIAAGTARPAAVTNVATLVALDATAGADLSPMDQALGLKTVTLADSFVGSPGFKEETGTLVMIEAFLYVIAGLLVGAFFTVWTIQRTQEIGLVKALGASTRYLLVDALGQAAIVLVAATAVGVAVGVGLGLAIPSAVPFALELAPIALAAVLVIVMGLLGSTLSIRRITKVDPLIALGAH